MKVNLSTLLLLLLLLSSFLACILFGGAGFERVYSGDIAIIPAVAAALVGAGAAQLSSDINNMRSKADWNEANEYNSPVEQRRRLEAAGINPSLAMGAGQLGNGNASTLPNRQPYQVPVDTVANSIINERAQRAQENEQNANARYLNARADTHAAEASTAIAEALSRIDSMKIDSKYKEALRQKVLADYDLAVATTEDNKRLAKNQADYVGERVLTEQFNRQLATAQLDLSRRLTAAEISNLSSAAALAVTQASEMVKNGANERTYKRALKEQIDEAVNGLKLDNESKENLAPVIYKQALWQMRNTRKQARSSRLGPFSAEFGYGAGPLGSFFDD